MSKYSTEFKLQIIDEYLEGGLDYRSLTNKYVIPKTVYFIFNSSTDYDFKLPRI